MKTLMTALLILSANVLFAADAMQATLVVPDTRLLPGVPFDFWIVLHNGSSTVRHVTVCTPFALRLASGEPFEWHATREEMMPRGPLYWPHGGDAVVEPGETKVLAIPASDAAYGSFFRDRRFSALGRRFAISLSLCDQAGNETSKLITNEVEIEIMTPTGSDAVVWNLLEEKSGNRWTPAEIWSPSWRPMWESIIRNSPDSNYVPYAVLMTNQSTIDWRDDLARQLRTIRRFSTTPVVEWLHVEARRTARAVHENGVMLAEGAILSRSKRPTTRLLASDH